jgi:hypothetical protein
VEQREATAVYGQEAEDIVARLVGVGDARVARPLKLRKSRVFLLEAADGPSLTVAKLAVSETIDNEHRILGALAAAPVRALRTYGTAVSSWHGMSWLVSEYANGLPFDRHRSDHRRVLARWLGSVHTWSNSTGPLPLPDRSVDYHRRVVVEARDTLAVAGNALPRDTPGREQVGELREVADRLLRTWPGIAASLKRLPDVLVHSGLAGKNVVLAGEPGTTVVLAFDWEQGGWGCAAADLSIVDLDSYVSVVSESWPRLNARDYMRAASYGRVLWCLAAVPGERANLVGQWPQRALSKMTYYVETCRDAFTRISEW